MKKRIIGILLGAGMCLAAQAAEVTNTWTGGGADGAWSTTANWNVTPTSATNVNVFFNSVLSNTNTYLGTTARTVHSLNFGAGVGNIMIGLNDGATTGKALNLGGVNAIGAINSDMLAAGDITIGGVRGTVNLGNNLTIAHNGTGMLTIDRPIAGAFAITNSGSGKVTLSGGNTYSGGTVLKSGVVIISGSANLGSGLLTMAGGTLSNSAGVVLTNDISLSSSGNFGVMTGTTEKFSGSISGTGALNKTDAGVLHLLGSNSYSGGTVINAGRLSISNGNALGTGTLTLNGGSTLFALSNSTQNVTITNNIALGAGANVLLSQDVNMTQVVSGVISGDGMMQKVNALGTLVLNGANTYTNTTSVGAGKMIVNGSLLSSLITVTGLATLSGTGTVEAVTVNAGGILSVGSSPGTMTFNGALTLGNGSTNLMEIFTTGSDVIKGNGANTLTMNGTTVLDFTGNTVADYTTLDLFKNWGSIVTNSTTTFTAVGLASGQSLDLSHLTTGGPITVIPEPATIGMLGLGALVTLLIRRMGARY